MSTESVIDANRSMLSGKIASICDACFSAQLLDTGGMWIRQGLQSIVDGIVPRSCAFCGAVNECNICVGCRDDLPWIELPGQSAAAPLQCLLAPLCYDFPVDAAIKAFKFRRKLFYAPAFAEVLCALCEQLPNDIDAVLPVPLHWRRKAMRGFNQATELAKPVAKHINVPIIRNVRRRLATPFQSGLAANDRERNLRQAFIVRRPISAEHVLIIDDVVTTGATVRSLARVLLAGGASRVSVLAVARSG